MLANILEQTIFSVAMFTGALRLVKKKIFIQFFACQRYWSANPYGKYIKEDSDEGSPRDSQVCDTLFYDCAKSRTHLFCFITLSRMVVILLNVCKLLNIAVLLSGKQ